MIWEYPPLTLLSDGPGERADRGDVKKNADIIKSTLDSFGIMANVVEVNKGPAITEYALEIALGTKVSKIQSIIQRLGTCSFSSNWAVRIKRQFQEETWSVLKFQIADLSLSHSNECWNLQFSQKPKVNYVLHWDWMYQETL